MNTARLLFTYFIMYYFIFSFICCFTLISVSQARDFSTDVIGITEAHLSADFWLNKQKSKSQLLMTSAQIDKFNKQLIRENPYILSPLSIPDFLTDVELNEKINNISSTPSAPRFYAIDKQVTTENYAGYIENTNQINVQLKNEVLFALVVKRTALRRFPTSDKVYKYAEDKKLSQSIDKKNVAPPLENSLKKHLEKDLDMFQESALFIGDAVAVLHTSKDGLWYLVQAYNYLAWLPKTDVAIGNKTEISAFKNATDFVVVTGSKVFTRFVPSYFTYHSQLSEVQLDMGIRLPRAKRGDYGDSLYGQNPYTSYVVKIPIKNAQEKLHFALVAIARSQEVSVGYLPFTQRNLIKQSFKFLGERYGWGHDYNSRDCTGFVDEVYKSFGFMMPRNSGQQAKSDYGHNQFFENTTVHEDKLSAIAKMQVGDLIYIPGHVMMYLGHDQGKPYIIHDVKKLSYNNKDGELYQGTLNGVSVTPLLPLKDYVKNITSIKRINSQ